MKIEAIELHNFGLFNGRHKIELSNSKARPITLVIGKNGRGKTTILDGVKLALYGRRARASGRAGSSYEEYLRASIHQGASREHGASVGVRLRTFVEGKYSSVDVERYWSVGKGGRVAEKLDVLVDGVRHPELMGSWDSYIEGWLPVAVSDVVYFDGEKLEDLVSAERCADVIGGSIRALLGAGLVRTLNQDLQQVLKARIKESSQGDATTRFAAVVDRMQALDSELHTVAMRTAEAQVELDSALLALEQAQESRRIAGGLSADDFEALKLNARRLRTKEAELRGELRAMLAGPLPLLLLGPTLDDVEQAVTQTISTRGSVRQLELLDSLIADIQAIAPGKGARQYAQSVTNLLKGRREELSTSLTAPLAWIEPTTPLSPTRSELEQLAALAHEAEAGINEARQLADDAESRLRLSGSSVLNDLDNEISQLSERIDALRGEIEGHIASRKALHQTKERLGQEHRTLLEHISRTDRLIDRISTEIRVVERFESQLIGEALLELEERIVDRFHYLLGKGKLLGAVTIQPGGFELGLSDARGRALQISRLSAGERQLLAISVIWSISAMSGTSLTAIIDTPLARLDKEHRASLLERYFPEAGENVLILATDAEVGPEDLKAAGKRIDSVQELIFESERGQTSIHSRQLDCDGSIEEAA